MVTEYDVASMSWTNPVYQLKKSSGWAYINYYCKVSGGVPSFEYAVAALPEELKPNTDIRSTAWVADSSGKRYAASIRIYADGQITLAAGANFSEVGFTVAYPINL